MQGRIDKCRGQFVFTTGVLIPNLPVINTKWPWHLSILPWIPGTPFAVHTCIYVCRELSKRVLLQTFREDSTWLNRLRGKQWSVIQRTSKYVTVTLDTDEESINVLCVQTYSWKEKLAVLMLPRFQGSLQRTKTLILKPGKRFTWIYRSNLRRRVC
jgi:hypothetical protein